ncbi:Predicted ATPase of the ABC class [Seminavis robusta]|uniref:Predicted ATPase of the ABC class n=1 Tax=Seminavis robusta TaxID=568900 RepID=A0A9N8DGR2_9STRA|nr:Predicted ATPase of the ABC class [Seminavis robusta]|eukprot:Sro150_g068910.1 Predicted ATPase of the ABC class (450) ;mRNA; r:77759-79563
MGGRGDYYKQKYGGGGRGRGRGGRGRGGGGGGRGRGNGYDGGNSNNNNNNGGSMADLRRLLQQMDGRQYPSYHDLETTKGWVNTEAGITLYVGRAQSDPFAPPTRCRVVLQNSVAQIPPTLYSNPIRAMATRGFHGKSTLLQALQLGVYLKLPGDGREFCVTSPHAMKIRAEDGRAVSSVDISPFINNLPFGKDTTNFTTPDASGSTSQASNIVESIEAGATALLIDEDTAAANFMCRDDKMVQLVAAEKEPITPFVRLVRSLYQEIGISSVLVIGGSGDFFAVADNVVMMDCYKTHDATDRAKQIAAQASGSSNGQHSCQPGVFQKLRSSCKRYPVGDAYNPAGKTKVMSKIVIQYGETTCDLAGLEQLVTKAQTNTITNSLQKIASIASNDGVPLSQVLDQIEQAVAQQGLDVLAPGQFHGGLARARRLEIAGAINRLRRTGNIVQR